MISKASLRATAVTSAGAAMIILSGLPAAHAQSNEARLRTLLASRPKQSEPKPISDMTGIDLAAQFDVVGIRLGTLAEDAITVLKARGFTVPDAPGWTRKQCDWNCEVDRVVAVRRGRPAKSQTSVLQELTAVGPSDQRVKLTFAAAPGGAKVREITYAIPRTQITREALLDQVARKYGKNLGRSGSIKFCFGDYECPVAGNDEIYLPYIDDVSYIISGPNPGYFYQFTLHEGYLLAQRREAAFSNYINQVAPILNKADF